MHAALLVTGILAAIGSAVALVIAVMPDAPIDLRWRLRSTETGTPEEIDLREHRVLAGHH